LHKDIVIINGNNDKILITKTEISLIFGRILNRLNICIVV